MQLKRVGNKSCDSRQPTLTLLQPGKDPQSANIKVPHNSSSTQCVSANIERNKSTSLPDSQAANRIISMSTAKSPAQMCHHVTTVGNVAFSAVVSDDRRFQPNEIVKFDDVQTNIGNAYNKYVGIFTAPKPGLYVFHVHALSMDSSGFWFTLYHNDVPLYKAHGQSGHGFNSGGNSIALSLKSGETVYVKVHDYPSAVYGKNAYKYATFTGYLVAAETDEQATSWEACQR